MAEPIRLNVRENVGEALRFVRGNWRFIGVVALAASGAALVCALLSGLVQPLALLFNAASFVLATTAYAALLATALNGRDNALKQLWSNGLRVWTAMVVVVFLLFIVMLVLSVVVLTIVFTPYAEQLQAVQQDEAATRALMDSILTQNPMPFLFAFLALAVVWLLLTSRLYLAAPASLASGRILTLETWKWTKGHMLRILWSRLMLLLPANVLAGALVLLLARLFGINLMTADGLQVLAQANPAAAMVWFFVANTIIVMVYSALEAGLSVALYRSLKPASAPAPSTDSRAVG